MNRRARVLYLLSRRMAELGGWRPGVRRAGAGRQSARVVPPLAERPCRSNVDKRKGAAGSTPWATQRVLARARVALRACTKLVGRSP